LAQVIGVAVNFAWASAAGLAAYWATGKLVGGHRVAPEVEFAGLDADEMGIHAYPQEEVHGVEKRRS
jgi:ammonia channel protein AmtB